MLNPCQNCSNRYYRCHSECKAYSEYREEIQKRNEFLKIQNSEPQIETFVKIRIANSRLRQRGLR